MAKEPRGRAIGTTSQHVQGRTVMPTRIRRIDWGVGIGSKVRSAFTPVGAECRRLITTARSGRYAEQGSTRSGVDAFVSIS